MHLTRRPYVGKVDLPAILDLIRAAPPLSRHLIDFPWRLCSPTVHTPADARVWTEPDGTVLGFAAWQNTWAALDFYVRPGHYRQEVEVGIFDWASERFRALDIERGHPLPYWAEASEHDSERLALLADHGYTLDDEYVYIMLSRTLVEPLRRHVPPDGFVIRPLAGGDEVDNYVKLHRRAFASTSITATWRTETLLMPQYRPELDLVGIAPDGRMAGFCIGWLAPEQHAVQIEPAGVDPEFQRLGLGRALMFELFQRCKALGVEHVFVETDSGRWSARRAYEAVGFRPAYQSLRKGKLLSTA